jgi:hypothetical protein
MRNSPAYRRQGMRIAEFLNSDFLFECESFLLTFENEPRPPPLAGGDRGEGEVFLGKGFYAH